MTKKSDILGNISNRSEEFHPNPKLDKLISTLKRQLEPIQLSRNEQFVSPKKPVCLVVGNPRSGTTLLTQILASSNSFSYPTNFLSRFAYAPELGALIQQMLFNKEYDFLNELCDIPANQNFNSNLGRTKGALGINQFFHFWRKFFPNHDPKHLSEKELKFVEVKRMRSELASIENVFDQPFLSKGMMLQFNIDFFAKEIPEFIFFHIKRQHKFVMQSLLLSRRKYYKTEKIWYSVKPKEYEWLSNMNPLHQIAGQVLFTEKAIEKTLQYVPENRKVICNYEELCDKPKFVYDQIYSLLKLHGVKLSHMNFENEFVSGNDLKINKEELDDLENAYEELKTKYF